jgi:large subunit ribosomal protein L3
MMIVDVMETGLIGKKLGMTQVYLDDGLAVPVTVLEVEPSVVIQRKTKEKDSYNALQLGYVRVKQKSVSKPRQGHFAKADKGCFRILKEIKSDEACEPGYEFKADMFQNGDYVDIIGTTKGKGFAGVIKRHGFSGGRATHGSMFHRAPGSIGASAYPSRVFKGKKLPGHMGDVSKTVQNIMVIAVRSEKNLILVKGAVPGCRNSIVIIKKSKKKNG